MRLRHIRHFALYAALALPVLTAPVHAASTYAEVSTFEGSAYCYVSCTDITLTNPRNYITYNTYTGYGSRGAVAGQETSSVAIDGSTGAITSSTSYLQGDMPVEEQPFGNWYSNDDVSDDPTTEAYEYSGWGAYAGASIYGALTASGSGYLTASATFSGDVAMTYYQRLNSTYTDISAIAGLTLYTSDYLSDGAESFSSDSASYYQYLDTYSFSDDGILADGSYDFGDTFSFDLTTTIWLEDGETAFLDLWTYLSAWGATTATSTLALAFATTEGLTVSSDSDLFSAVPAVPLPASALLLLCAIAGLPLLRRRERTPLPAA
ncbi:VPLPA-CTERM sorting domain-containing protein [Thioclava sp. 'Guangxiensis']|uniref:VPLPA-CTERM sorting domain-containing protein n=1 Tax=Thioclava sp. 'Guangxiensis' TaxID=3149044 RepID=UPI0038783106